MTIADQITEDIERAIVRHGQRPSGIPAGASYTAILIPRPDELIAEIREIVARAHDETTADSAQTRAWNGRE